MSTPPLTPAPLMISISGVRGIIGQSLTPQVATLFGQAFGHFLKSQPLSNLKSQISNSAPRPAVLIGRDSRPSGPLVMGALASGLLSVGIDVIEAGIATTPSIALLGRFLHTSASIVITASHNPLPWNGIKFLRHDGISFPADQAAQIKQIFLDLQSGRLAIPLADIDHLGSFSEDSRAHAHHIQTVLALFDARGIAHQRFRVVLDSVNGAGCIGTPMLLGKLGAELIHMNAQATGLFAHTPEPTRENLTALCAKVKEKRAAVGFAQDPDADRLALVDENGTYIGEEYTLALCTYARMLIKPVPVVTNLSTSRMVDDIAQKFGQKVYRTPVGEAHVAGQMQQLAARSAGFSPPVRSTGSSPPARSTGFSLSASEQTPASQLASVIGGEASEPRPSGSGPPLAQLGSVIGGEGNGGIIDLRVGPVRDSFLGIAVILDLMTRTKKPLSELTKEFPAYAMIKTKFDCTPDQSAALVARLKTQFATQQIDTQDGIRIDFPEGWVHARQSNTEPIARIIAEAKDEPTARALIAQIEALK